MPNKKFLVIRDDHVMTSILSPWSYHKVSYEGIEFNNMGSCMIWNEMQVTGKGKICSIEDFHKIGNFDLSRMEAYFDHRIVRDWYDIEYALMKKLMLEKIVKHPEVAKYLKGSENCCYVYVSNGVNRWAAHSDVSDFEKSSGMLIYRCNMVGDCLHEAYMEYIAIPDASVA